ncbi:SEC14-like protein 2 [Folsomia candida]|uniref:SEC14-like protein 2 n=1 Tax=Folsomia candida TaxID=158441 RepID=UPI001604FB05|nr:SEC14-like protein 2 [Folsomia candida]
MCTPVLLVFFILNGILGQAQNEDLVISWEQKLKLDEFRKIMEPNLPHDYMKKDIYLVKWLKARNFDIPAATKMLQENLRWRQETKMDTIFNEDWSETNTQYRFALDGCDRHGTPVFIIFVGEWDMRKAVLAGQSDKMRRYLDKCFEEVATVLRNMQENGSNATRASLMLDAASLSISLQFCPGCIPLYLYLVQTWGTHYPNLFNLGVVINSPDFLVPIWTNLIKPFSPSEIQKIVDIYGRKKSVWRDALATKYGIDWTTLSHEMGGDGPDPVDANDLRKAGYQYECSSS